MIHFVDNNGTIIKTIESPVYQGSAESNNIILIAPFAANLQFTVAFFLPNGEITPRYAMTQGGTLNGVEYAPTNGAMAIWTFSMPNNITQYFGTVYAQFYAYGTNGQITASSRTSFVVARGVPEELPDTPDQTIYNQILTIISQINTALNNGSYAARAIYWWINTYTYGMNEITFYPIGTYGAFVRSTVTGNTGNQPYTDDGVLDSAHWQELVNFNKIYAAEQNAVESAQNAAQSEANAAASAQAAAQSASSAAQSAQTAEKYAADAEEAGSKFSDLVNSGEIGNFVIQGEENKLTWSPNLWDYPNYLQVAKDVYVSETLSSGVRISYESIEVFRSDGDRFTSYEIGQIRDVSEESYNRTFALPSQAGTLALTSDVAAEASERESADNALQSDIDGIQQQLSETQHFRGYYETTAQVQSISNPHSGDYAWNAQTGTVWNYSTSWSDSGVAIPDQTVPKSSTTPLMDGTATLGSTNTYADGGHRHPTDTTRASVIALNSETESRTAADSNLQSQIDDIKDGTTVVGRATNVTSQINGHAISDIFETDGTTVKEATQAQRASELSTIVSDVINVDWNNVDWTLFNAIWGANWRNTLGIYKCRGQTNSSLPAEFSNTYQITINVWFEGYANIIISDSNIPAPFLVANVATTWTEVTFGNIAFTDGSYPNLGAGTAEIANRTGSIVIQNNADLNDCTANLNEVQVYTCQTNATAATLSNCPVDVTFTMWTTRAFEESSNSSRDFQFLIAINSQCYYRVRSGGTTWANWRTLVESDGTYNGMTVGAVLATQLTNQDIHDFQGPEYWGKTYFGAGRNTVQNKPEGVDGFYLEVLRGGTSSTIHKLIATADTSGESVSPNIYIEQYVTSWSSWEEVATSDGSYPTLGAGHLPNNYIYAGGSSDPKWYKIATITNAPNLAAASLLLSINGIFATQDNQYGAETGQIEFDAANASGRYSCSATLNYGNINTNNVCVVQNGSTAELYYHFDSNYQAILVTVMSFYGGSTASYELTDVGVSAAPSNAIYAVNRNFARPLFIANQTLSKTPTVNTDMALDGGVSPDGSIIGDEVIFYCVYGIYTYTCTGKIKSISGSTPTVTVTGIVSQANANDNAKTKRVKVYAFNSETDFCDIFIEFKTTNTTEVSDISTLGSQLTAAGYGQATTGNFAFAFGSVTNVRGRVCPVYGAYVVGSQVSAILVEPVEDATGGFNTWNESDCTVEEIWLR